MEIQLDALCTLLAAGLLYWLGDWLIKRPALRDRLPIPAPFIGAVLFILLNFVCRMNGNSCFSFHNLTQGAMVYVAASSLGLTIQARSGPNRLRRLCFWCGRQVRKNWLLPFPTMRALQTTFGRCATALCLLAFCMFSGYVLMGSIRQLLGLPLPDWLASMAIAILLRSTSEMTQEEYPDREFAFTGRLSLGMFLTTAVAELPL